jgi:hypothetical protein
LPHGKVSPFAHLTSFQQNPKIVMGLQSGDCSSTALTWESTDAAGKVPDPLTPTLSLQVVPGGVGLTGSAVSGTATLSSQARIANAVYFAYPRLDGVLVEQLTASSAGVLELGGTWKFVTTSHTPSFTQFNDSLSFIASPP